MKKTKKEKITIECNGEKCDWDCSFISAGCESQHCSLYDEELKDTSDNQHSLRCYECMKDFGI